MNGKKGWSLISILGQVATVSIVCLAITNSSASQDRGVSSETDTTRIQARYLFDRGVSLYKSGDYERALEAFQQAYNLRPSPAVRVNIANCYDQMDRPLEAIFNFERFLADTEGDTGQKRAVEGALKRLRGKIGEVTIQVVPDGAEVQIDSSVRRQSPIIEPVRLTTGTHIIDVTAPDYQPERREIEVLGGRPMEVSIVLRRRSPSAQAYYTPVVKPGPHAKNVAPEEPKPVTPETEPVSPPPAEKTEDTLSVETPETPASGTISPEEPKMERRGSSWTPVIITGGITAALAIAAGITGGLALNANSDYKQLAAEWNNASLSPVARARARNEANNAAYRSKNLALATDVLLGCTAVGAAVTIWLALTRKKPAESAAASAVLPAVGAHSAALVLSGTL